MGKRLGYSISESVRGFSGMVLVVVISEIILFLVLAVEKCMGYHVQ
jgi:hypothetical protein